MAISFFVFSVMGVLLVPGDCFDLPSCFFCFGCPPNNGVLLCPFIKYQLCSTLLKNSSFGTVYPFVRTDFVRMEFVRMNFVKMNIWCLPSIFSWTFRLAVTVVESAGSKSQMCNATLNWHLPAGCLALVCCWVQPSLLGSSICIGLCEKTLN